MEVYRKCYVYKLDLHGVILLLGDTTGLELFINNTPEGDWHVMFGGGAPLSLGFSMKLPAGKPYYIQFNAQKPY